MFGNHLPEYGIFGRKEGPTCSSFLGNFGCRLSRPPTPLQGGVRDDLAKLSERIVVIGTSKLGDARRVITTASSKKRRVVSRLDRESHRVCDLGLMYVSRTSNSRLTFARDVRPNHRKLRRFSSLWEGYG